MTSDARGDQLAFMVGLFCACGDRYLPRLNCVLVGSRNRRFMIDQRDHYQTRMFDGCGLQNAQ